MVDTWRRHDSASRPCAVRASTTRLLRSAARSEQHRLLAHRGCVRHICTCGQAGRPRVRQMSPSRIRIEPSSSYDLFSMSILAALRIRARFFETDAIGSDAEARNLFLRTSIEILHSTRFPPTTAAIVATLVIGFQDSSRGNEISLSSVFRVRPPVNFTVLPFQVDTAAGHCGVHRQTLSPMHAGPAATRFAQDAGRAATLSGPPPARWHHVSSVCRLCGHRLCRRALRASPWQC